MPKSSIFLSVHGIVWFGVNAWFGSVCGAETIHITPKNGVPSAWELVTVEPDRVVVRKGGARFEFSKDQIEKVSNPEASSLVEAAELLLSEVDKHDPETFSTLETKLGEILPRLESSAKSFSWVIPELPETRDRVTEAKEAISKTLDLTGEFQEGLKAIELMAVGRSPVASNWEEVVDQTLQRAKEIPFEDIRGQVVTEIEKFRRTIRLSLVRRTEETEQRVRTRGDQLIQELQQGKIDPAQWALVLRDLRRQVAEEVPDADLRLELEAYLNRIETDSQDNLSIAEGLIAQRGISRSLVELQRLVLDTTQSERFNFMADDLSARIDGLPDSVTREELRENLALYRSDHQEALAQLQRVPQPEPASGSPVEASGNADPLAKFYGDWRVLTGGAVGLVVILALLQTLISKGWKKRRASEIEDVKVLTPEGGVAGWAGGQDDLMSILGGGEKPQASQEIRISPTPESTDEDPFGIATSEPKNPEDLPLDHYQLVNPARDREIETHEEDPFRLSATPETDSERSRPETDSTPEMSTGPEVDPFGFSSIFGEEEPEESIDQVLPGSETSPAKEEPQATPPPTPATEDDPFGLLTVIPESEKEKEVEDLFAPPKPAEPKVEEDIFGFGNYFDESDTDSSKSK